MGLGERYLADTQSANLPATIMLRDNDVKSPLTPIRC